MKFSVLIPVYNVEKYLDQCLRSLLNQKHQEFEIILVNDGSTDSSGKICDVYKAKYPDKFQVIHKANEGQLATRLLAIQNATGDYCIFVDSDDFVELDLLSTLNQILENDDLDMLLYSFKYFQDGRFICRKSKIADDGARWTLHNKQDLYKKLMFESTLSNLWSKAIRTSLLKSDDTDYTPYFGKNMAEDLLHSLYPLTHARRISYIDRPVYCYRYNETSVSRNYQAAALPRMNTIHVYHKICEYLPLWKLDDSDTHNHLAGTWANSVFFIFTKYYEHAESQQERRQILRHDWESMLPQKTDLLNNKHMNPNYRHLYRWWKTGRFYRIRLYFAWRSVYAGLRQIKKSIAGIFA